MRKPMIVLAAMFLVLTSLSYSADNKKGEGKKKDPPLTLKVGDTAPGFSLLAFDGKELKKVSLSDYKGKKNVALAFYVFAFTGG